MANKQIQITAEGLDALKKELKELIETKRPKLVERLANAREQGDLSENSDYTSAKDELEFLDNRIDELNHVVDTAVVSNNSGKKGQVAMGTRVTLTVNGDKHEFNIVGEWEADPVNKKISHNSPLGLALVGKMVGEVVEVDAPAGKVKYKIVSVS
jgi:transcription elongation factor GreA